jgi:uncharacterized membrane protein
MTATEHKLPGRRSLYRRIAEKFWSVARYPDHYCWYILASTLDIVTTFIIVEVYGGGEANRIAARIFDRYGWPGMILLKYATVILVIAACEVVGRRRFATGRRLATLAIAVGALPVLWGAIQLWLVFRGVMEAPPMPQ